MNLKSTTLEKFASIVGPQACLTDASAMQPFLSEWRGRLEGRAPCVLLPQNTEQVAEIVKICAAEKIAVVPQAGNTGLSGASVPVAENPALCLSVRRMNAIRSIDAADFSMVAEAGCVLQAAKDAAGAQDRLLAVTLAAEGSACIGGLVAANAGGSFTLRYDTMREQVLGLEVVLPDGRIWRGLGSLHKTNSGYDLKHAFIGSEGTLGIITAATLKLRPQPGLIETAFVALDNPAAAIAALGPLRTATNDTLAAFELMPELAVTTAVKVLPRLRAPFTHAHPWLALVETHAAGPPLLQEALASLLARGLIRDAAMAGNSQDFWRLREGIVEAQKHLGASLKHDIAVPVAQVPEMIAQGSQIVQRLILGARPYAFGHVGDGNIHFNVSQPEGGNKGAFLGQRHELATALHDAALRLNGSISAEHGIGRFKRDEFYRTADPAGLSMMRKIKQALDPDGIMNPGVLF